MNVGTQTLKHMIGKTISGMVLRDNLGAGPRDQLFLVFTDNTYLEFYGEMGWAEHLEVGNLETVKQYAARSGETVKIIP